MSKIIINILLSFIILSSHGQVINPRIWMFGYTSPQTDTNSLDTGIYKKFGINTFDFRYNPYAQSRISHALGMPLCNAFIFNKNDSLILYSNGSKIFNGKHRLIEGGDKLSYGSEWTSSVYKNSYFAHFVVSVYAGAIIALPSVANSNQYYLLSVFINSDNSKFPRLTYTLVDMSLNGGNGKVLEKEKLIKEGDVTQAITACKHGNGRDWWIISREYGKKNFTVMLLDSSGIKIVSDDQNSGWDLNQRSLNKGNFCNRFSWDGKQFASFNYEGLEIFDFDRCQGKLSNRRQFVFPIDDTSTNTYVCYSSNNQLVYANQGHKIYQIELKTNNVIKIADWDLREDTVDGGTAGFYTSFGFPQLAPDGKIYYSTTESTRYLHVIEKPNEIGGLCSFKQRSIKLLNWNSGLPNFPNYELGAVADKCGESGIANNEIEKIEVYPNPASDFVEISPSTVIQSRYISGLIRNLSFTLTNLLGQQTSPLVEVTNRGHRIDTRSLPEGIYLLQVSDKNHNLIKTERLVITR